MGKKRTGLQSNIAAIFSGVPIPKKGQPGSEKPAPAAKPDASTGAKPPVPQPRAPAPPSAAPAAARPAVQPIPEIAPRVIPAAAHERKAAAIPSKPPRHRKAATGPGAGVSATRQRVAIGMIVFLSVLLVILLTKPFGRSRPGPAAPGGIAVAPAVAAAAPKASVKIDWPVPQVYPVGLRDPMAWGKQEVIVPQTPNALVVKGITYSEERKFAVIGTLTLQEGETVAGTDVKILKINPDSVEFEDSSGKKWTQGVQGDSNSR